MISLFAAMMAALFITVLAVSAFGPAFFKALEQTDIYSENN